MWLGAGSRLSQSGTESGAPRACGLGDCDGLPGETLLFYLLVSPGHLWLPLWRTELTKL
jgi:hypothetical protein